MTAVPEPSTVKRALSAHAAIGLLASALLYIVCLTGTLAVFYQEWQRVEQPGVPEMPAIDAEAVQRGVEAALAQEAGGARTTHLYVHLPAAGLPRATITTDTRAVHLNRDGSIWGPEEIAWSDFLVQLHYTLNVPGLIGITIVGALGAMMLALSLSGVIAHPRIFRDAFRLRARSGGGVGLADWHNRLSVWTLPFGIAIALTGAMIGLATITAQGVAALGYKGETEAFYAPIFGKEAAPDPAPAPIVDVGAALRHMKRTYPDVTVTYAILHDPQTAGQHVQVIGTHPRRLIFGEYYAFDAAGRFHGTAGLADGKTGQQVAASTYNLHFGNYGGLPVKMAYGLLGLALTAICGTGVHIWLGKRRRRGMAEPRLRAAWNGVLWGTPAALALTFAARIVGGNDLPLAAMFWMALALFLAAVTARPGMHPGRRQMRERSSLPEPARLSD